MVTYNIEQEQIRKAEEDRLRDEAEKAERERRLGLVLKAQTNIPGIEVYSEQSMRGVRK